LKRIKDPLFSIHKDLSDLAGLENYSIIELQTSLANGHEIKRCVPIDHRRHSYHQHEYVQLIARGQAVVDNMP
jgi:hypothetical protein